MIFTIWYNERYLVYSKTWFKVGYVLGVWIGRPEPKSCQGPPPFDIQLRNLKLSVKRRVLILLYAICRNFTNAYIEFSKPLIAAINGPAIGIAVTVLGLCDLVYASDSASFHTPFMSLGQSPEGCSSLLFPRIMGYAKVKVDYEKYSRSRRKREFDSRNPILT